MALQAQEPASPYLALWNRMAGFDPADLDRAFADHSIVKASLMRIDPPRRGCRRLPGVPCASMSASLRAARLNDRRFGATGLSHRATPTTSSGTS